MLAAGAAIGVRDAPRMHVRPLCLLRSPAVLHSGSVDTPGGPIRVTIVCNGKSSDFGVDNVGTVPAALSTFLAIEALKPDIVINAGTCGGFQACGGRVGDVYVSTGVANHDRRIQIPGCALCSSSRAHRQAALCLVGLSWASLTGSPVLHVQVRQVRRLQAGLPPDKQVTGGAGHQGRGRLVRQLPGLE